MCVSLNKSLHIKHRQCLSRPEEGIGLPGNGVAGSWEAPGKCWELKQFSLRLTIESSLQLHMVANFMGLLIIYVGRYFYPSICLQK